MFYKSGGGGVDQSVMDEDTHGNLEAEDSNPGWLGQVALIQQHTPLNLISCEAANQELVELGTDSGFQMSSLNSQHNRPDNRPPTSPTSGLLWAYPSLQPSFA